MIDASVAGKWALPGQDGETHQEQVLGLLTDIQQGKCQVPQPPHWLAEVGAVFTQLAPQQSISMLQTFLAMELPITTEWNVYEQACRLAGELNHHLFDTLYHAVALHVPDTLFITADTQYFRKAAKLGHIIELKTFPQTG
ncbi:MAG TPA: type II toxin-antitoxin system VapC family toxin [Nitrospirales bacterium]|nr:PIN domain-containing protein [Nitrospiraceae bacterium]HNP28628.1 type II toxin-antitoxin system VapC family toxin [Nitrospirales bacterium]